MGSLLSSWHDGFTIPINKLAALFCVRLPNNAKNPAGALLRCIEFACFHIGLEWSGQSRIGGSGVDGSDA